MLPPIFLALYLGANRIHKMNCKHLRIKGKAQIVQNLDLSDGPSLSQMKSSHEMNKEKSGMLQQDNRENREDWAVCCIYIYWEADE